MAIALAIALVIALLPVSAVRVLAQDHDETESEAPESLAAPQADAPEPEAGIPAALEEVRFDAYVRARLAETDRALPQAARAYREAVAADPSSVELAQRGYRQAVLAGDRDLALRTAFALDAAGKLSRDGTVLLLADALDRKKWVEASARIDRLEAENNLAFLAPYMRAWVSLALGRYTEPVAPSEQSSAAFGIRYMAEQRLLLALARGDKASLDTAFAEAEEDIDSFGPVEKAMIASRLARLGRRDLALQILGATGAEDAEAQARLKRVSKLYRKQAFTPQFGLAMLMNRLALDLRSQDDGIAMLSMARMAGFADPALDDARVTIARAALMADLPQLAYEEAGKVAPASPGWFDAQTVQLRALLDQDRDAEALTRAEQLIRDDGGSGRSWRLLGDIQVRREAFAEAAIAYGHVRDSLGAREDASLLLQLGGALEQAGKWDEARPLLERVVQLAPDSAVALNHLGYALAERGDDLPRAITLLEKANRIRPKEPAYVDSLGWAYFKSGDLAKALPLIQSAVMAEPGNPELNDHLGDVLWAMGRRFEARYAWQAALIGLDRSAGNAADAEARLRRKIEGLNDDGGKGVSGPTS